MSPCSLGLCMQLTVICFSVNMVFCQMMLCGCSVKESDRMEKTRKKNRGERDLSGSLSPEQDASYFVMHRTSRRCGGEGGDVSMCVRDAERPGRMEGESRWRWRWSASEKEMTSLRKCWAGFHGYWMREVFSHSLPSLPLLLFPLSLFWDVQCRSCSHPYTVS